MSCFGSALSVIAVCTQRECNLQGYLWIVCLLGALLVKCFPCHIVPAGPRETRTRHQLGSLRLAAIFPGNQANSRRNWRERDKGGSILTSLSECNQTSFLFQPNTPRISRSSGVAPLPASRMRSASSEWQAKMMWSNVSRFPVAVTSIVLPSLDETACTGVDRCSCPVGNRERIDSTYFVLQTKIRMKRRPCKQTSPATFDSKP